MTAEARSRRAVPGVLLAVLGAVVPLASGCVVASPDTDTYDDAARQAVRSAISESTTVEKLLHLLADDDIPRPAVVAQLRYSEQGLQGATSWFTGLNQPAGSDATAARLGTLMQDAGDLVANARVAIHRGQESQYADIASALDRVIRDLQKAEADVP
jgi:hypothetical protein